MLDRVRRRGGSRRSPSPARGRARASPRACPSSCARSASAPARTRARPPRPAPWRAGCGRRRAARARRGATPTRSRSPRSSGRHAPARAAAPGTASPRSGGRRRARHRPPARRPRRRARRPRARCGVASTTPPRRTITSIGPTAAKPTRPRATTRRKTPLNSIGFRDSSSATKEERTLVRRSVGRVLLASVAAGLIAARAVRTGSHCGDQAGVPQAQQQPVREAARVRHARGRACSPGRVPGDRGPRTAATAPPGRPGTTRASTTWSRSSRPPAGTSSSTCSTSRSRSRSSSTRRPPPRTPSAA